MLQLVLIWVWNINEKLIWNLQFHGYLYQIVWFIFYSSLPLFTKIIITSGGGGGLVSECFGRPVFILLLKKTGFAPWLRNMLSQIIYYWQEIFLFESDVRQWSQPYYCIICELNQSRECVVNLNVTWLGFVFVLISLFHMPDAVFVS